MSPAHVWTLCNVTRSSKLPPPGLPPSPTIYNSPKCTPQPPSEVTGYELSPAAAGLKEGTGHHHLVIDGPKAFVPPGEAIPFDDTHKHFGKAQTEGELELAPGKHKLTLQFANANHQSYGKEFAKTVTVNVKAD